MNLIFIVALLLSLSVVQTTIIETVGGVLAGTLVLNKVAQVAHIPHMVNIDAGVETNILGNKVDANAAYGIGEKGSGAHAAISADVLGQKGNIHADIYDGHLYDPLRRKVYKDNRGYYILVRQYVGQKSLLVKKYLTESEIQWYRIKVGKTFESDVIENTAEITLHKQTNYPTREIITSANVGVPRIPKDPTSHRIIVDGFDKMRQPDVYYDNVYYSRYPSSYFVGQPDVIYRKPYSRN